MKTNDTPARAGDELFKTDGGKTKSNAIEVPSISLPKGGGAIKGIDEKFTVNAANGTAAFAVPLPFSKARGYNPTHTLSYNSGSGNGIFGLGWNLNINSIKRKTENGLPQYIDAIDSDTFLLSDAEDLVPEFRKDGEGVFMQDTNGDYIINEKDSPDGLWLIRYYRPRIEGLFARIERWTEKASGQIRWRVISKTNSTTLYGWTSQARISDPGDSNKVYEWLAEFSFDDKGNCLQYLYKKEDNAGIDELQLHNKNRIAAGVISYTNSYPEKILYGNKTAYKKFGDAFPAQTDYMFSTVFDYGEYNTNSPFDKINSWSYRPDAFSRYGAGFEIRTTRLCKRILFYHHFTGPNEYDGLVKSINIEYDTSAEQGFTYLKKITSHGYIKKADRSYAQKNLPPAEFTYQHIEWNSEVKAISAEDIIHAPAGLDEQQYQFADLYNEGLAGILTEQATGLYYKHNLGNGKFEQAKLVTPKPSFTGVGASLQLSDLDADGGKQLVSLNAEPKGYFELDDDDTWQPYKPFTKIPALDLADTNVRMLDLDGDGKPEIVITEDHAFTWYVSDGRNGYSSARKTAKYFDEEAGPHIVFADPKQTIYLADMSGDGLTDIVRIKNGEVCYWPNLGYGRFGAKIGMDSAPVFDHPDSFNPSYIKLADIDGSGTADIIYTGKNKFSCWKNLSGNSFALTPFEIDAFPEIHTHAKLTVADLLGNGVACIVWSGELAKNSSAPLKYIDLMNSKKPHIMVAYKNNLGKEVAIEYKPSTRFYIEDKLSGKPWITKLPFPVHCIAKITTLDRVSGYRFITEYKYHHGYYDHPEKEFRGFGMVEQIDAETFEHWVKGTATNIVEEPLHQEPVVTKTWFHTGAFLRNDIILNQFEKDYWYNELELQGFPPVTHFEKNLPDARITMAEGINTPLIYQPTAEELREAYRTCKSMGLRSEVFAKDAVKHGNTEAARQKELIPFSVKTHNCFIELLQPRGKNKHAVYMALESEAITYSYEREPGDPRISHTLNIAVDGYGNVLESASVVYPRLNPDSSLPAETREEQNKTIIVYSQNQFTNDVIGSDTYCLRLPSEVKTYQLRAVPKSDTFYTPAEFENILSNAVSDSALYHETEKPIVAGLAQKRLVEHVRSLYYKQDLTAALPLHQLEAPVLPFEGYQLAYTPELVTHIFNTKVNDAMLTEGKFMHSEGDSNWWVRSGTLQYKTSSETVLQVLNRFYTPLSYTDPFGATTSVKYFGNYYLFVEETANALGNKTTVSAYNFRMLSPRKMKDANGNFSETICDELGRVKAVAIMGKGNEADELTGLQEITDAAEEALINNFLNATDSVQLTNAGKVLLQRASTRFVYDVNAFMVAGAPTSIAGIKREQHFVKNNNAPLQISFQYSNGTGEVIMTKAQAEPGLAKHVTVNPDNTITVGAVDTAASAPKQLRWIGNGRTIKNNKGNAVKQYEPYFSTTHRFEDHKELVESGVTPLMYYDAVGRSVKTEMPDGTLSRVIFTSWKKQAYDVNDTVTETQWYQNRTNRLIDAQLIAEGKDPVKEKQAADRAAIHSGTPNTLHCDSLGRPVLAIAHNKNNVTGADEYYHTRVKLDAEGNLKTVTDARNNAAVQYKYDMLGNKVYQNSMDAGQRWLLINIMGSPLRTWDERGHEFRFFYDILQRPTQNVILGGDGATALNHIFHRIIYGESLLLPNRSNEAALQARNILGQAIKHYDTGGLIDTPDYDFKGRPLATTRRLFSKYKETANWIDANLTADLETDTFTFATDTDALGRITRQVTPDNSVITPSYNETGLFNGESVLHAGAAASVVYIKDIDYNEKGQREKIIYGNDVSTKFYYDKTTLRLNRLESKRQNNDPLQDWYYTYDPMGNITHVEDKNIPVTFFNNQKITGVTEYTYDPMYRLIRAAGRENDAALQFAGCDNWSDKNFLLALNPGDPVALRSYTENYQYDSVGNIKEMRHTATGGNWTRTYEYETTNNRLRATQIGNNGSPANYTSYKHHAQHGYMEELPHLETIGWNFKEQVVLTSRQQCTDDGIPVISYYQYDGSGQRIRKITENQAAVGGTTTKKEERIYISGYELYKKHSGAHAGLQRTSLSLLDEGHRFVIVETRNNINDNTEKHLVRYQMHNHLGSAALELNEQAQVISYEEYHPFGTTAYQARNSAIRSAAKRYRYTGMERDEETGLAYHTARYYLPWLGRWLSCDPIGIKDGVNIYAYCGSNPIMKSDATGTQADAGTPSTSYGLTIDFSGGVRPGPFLVNPITVTDPGVLTLPSTSGATSCYGTHPTLGVYMQLGIGSECAATPNPIIFGSGLHFGGMPGSSGSSTPSASAPEEPAAPSEPAAPVDDGSVGEPGPWESLIPIWGSGRESINHFQHGNYGRAIFWGGMAVADVFLVKALVMGAGRLVLRTGATLLTREAEVVTARATAGVALDTTARTLTVEGADRLVAEAAEGTFSRIGPGYAPAVELLELESGWFVKRVGAGNAFTRNWGRMSIEAQEQGLLRLGDMAPEFFMRDGMLFTRSVGATTPRYFSSTFGGAWLRGSYRMGTIFNDIRPRNMGLNGLVFDPALDMFMQSFLWTGTYGTFRLQSSIIENQ